jgi:hypothetical protein
VIWDGRMLFTVYRRGQNRSHHVSAERLCRPGGVAGQDGAQEAEEATGVKVGNVDPDRMRGAQGAAPCPNLRRARLCRGRRGALAR